MFNDSLRKEPMMSRLYSYCLPFDDGAAPNPYWGTCTLVICKPAVRRTAEVGDWIAGTGAKYGRLGDGSTRDLSGCLIYAMKVTQKMTMEEYDAHTRSNLPNKIPRWSDPDPRRRLGDSIYDFTSGSVVQREGVHDAGNQQADLSGKFALLSDYFFYFGSNAVELPVNLQPIAQNRQGHRVRLNQPYLTPFVDWIESLGHEPRSLLGDPLLDLVDHEGASRWCAACRAEADAQDEEVAGC